MLLDGVLKSAWSEFILRTVLKPQNYKTDIKTQPMLFSLLDGKVKVKGKQANIYPK